MLKMCIDAEKCTVAETSTIAADTRVKQAPTSAR